VIRLRSRRHVSLPSHFARRWRSTLRLFGCFGVVFATTALIGLENIGGSLWYSNGVLLSYLLLAPRWFWPRYLATGFAAMLAGGVVLHPAGWRAYLALSTLNVLEVLIAAALLRKRSVELPEFTERRYLLRFAAYAILVAPATVGILSAIIYVAWMNQSPWHFLLTWIMCDGLGFAVAAPACVALFHSNLKLAERLKRDWIYFAAFVAVVFLSFSQARVPFIFLLYPIVTLVLFRRGLAWATLGTLLIAAIGGWFTMHGEGPFARIATVTPVGSSGLLQLFLASGIFMMYAASSVMDTLGSTERQLREIASLHELVTENSRDVIILAGFDGTRSYVSRAASDWGGWRPDELIGMKSLDLVHPEDRDKANSIVQRVRMGGEGGLLECRVHNKIGEYVWVEANLRAVRDTSTNAPIGILNMVRDISARKHAEIELKEAYAALEALAVTDPLTQLPNRRRFDQALADEWRRGLREGTPLSLLVLDVDWFKSYNDTYGHPRGDTCLKLIADAAQNVVMRPGDLLARIGGEEFAVILPNTPAQGAAEVAQEICAAIRSRRLEHNTNPLGIVTISAGCATIVPALGQHASALMQLADEALYAAKNAGRNHVCSAAAPIIAQVVMAAS
jgi:diguanylate cyclase (GGDEF)-like protein/PAS domain S-box-containing protein